MGYYYFFLVCDPEIQYDEYFFFQFESNLADHFLKEKLMQYK